jgi:hypothetical protein
MCFARGGGAESSIFAYPLRNLCGPCASAVNSLYSLWLLIFLLSPFLHFDIFVDRQVKMT